MDVPSIVVLLVVSRTIALKGLSGFPIVTRFTATLPVFTLAADVLSCEAESAA
jgi:hypothetical protein